MVLCLVALPIFSILAIFSARYRKLTLEALDCIFRTATFRKCRSGLEDRLKSSITGKLMKFSSKTAGFFFRHFKIIAWIFLIMFLWSAYASYAGISNYAKYGNCNGPDETGFCLFDPSGDNSKTSELDIGAPLNLVMPSLDEKDPIIGNKDAELTMIEFGCYACPYTKKAEPILKEVLEHYKGRINIQFKTFIIPHHHLSIMAA